ncbi:MAG: MipA/OmpV family protein, partial [Pseudomonadales bacterium]|nr:MipA/OmpV family protein [Pseudomonadales bacterium]
MRRRRAIHYLTFLFRMTLLALGFSSPVYAESWLEQLRSADLNDYALGLAVTNAQNPYEGAENGAFFYPYLTSFRDSAMTDDWLLIREGNIGIRFVSDTDWEFGFLTHVNTLGLGNNDAAELTQLRERNWTLEAVPMIGYRGWPVHLNLKSFVDILGRHNSATYSLSATWPMQFSRGYLVPGVEVVHAASDYNRYYFDVRPEEVRPDRPAYTTGASTNTQLKLRWGYALRDKWLLAGSMSLELLDNAVEDSPIVGRSHLWSASVGLAYNANMFRPRKTQRQLPDRFEFRVGAFRNSIDSTVSYADPDGSRGSRIDIEDELNAQGQATVLQLEGIYRIGHFHRVQFNYLKLERDGLKTLSKDISFGAADYTTGSIIESELETEIAQLSYGYSILRDDQKELGVSAGLHYAGIETQIASPDTGTVESSNSHTLLPVIGAFGSVQLSARITVGAKAQLFRMDFDRYEGSVNSFQVYAE